MQVSGQRNAPAALYLRERTPGTQWIGIWVGLIAGLDTRLEEESFASARYGTPVSRLSSL
jgi:hypothetical protein